MGGVAVKSLDAGGQAESTGKIKQGMLITHVNGQDVTQMKSMKEIGALLKAEPIIWIGMGEDLNADGKIDTQGRAQALPKPSKTKSAGPEPTVTLDTSDGKVMGMKLMKNPAGTGGVAVKSVDAGGQAEQTGKFNVGDIITHVNGTDVSSMKMKEIGPILKATSTIHLVLESAPPPPGKDVLDSPLPINSCLRCHS